MPDSHMHCIHVIPSYWPAMRYGGTVVAAHGLCKALVGLGMKVTVFTTDADGPNRLDVPFDRAVDVDGVQVRYFPLALYRPCYAPAMRSALEAQVGSADVVHLHSVFLWPTWAGGKAARRARVPYVVSPRGMLVRELIRRRHRLLKWAWLQLAERRTLRHAAAIHVTSDVEAEQIRLMGFDLSPVCTVGNGVEEPYGCMGEAAAVKAELGLAGHEPFILYLGRLSWKKGLDRLVRAMPGIRETKLVIAGNDDEGHWPALQKIIDECGVRERVVYGGPAYGERKWSLLRAASCFVLPSYSENFGNTVLEAMSAGCPAVVTPEVGASRLLADAGAGLVVSGEPAALAAAVSTVIENAGLRARMGEAGKQAARDRHSWAQRAEEMERLYRMVSERAGRAVG